MHENSQSLVPAEKYRRRLREKVKVIDEHWLWQGYVSKRGYGQIRVHELGTMLHTHILSFMVFKPFDFKWYLQINHKCEYKNCINPDHLYSGTQDENIQDAIRDGTGTQWMTKTVCQRGHSLTSENSYYRSNGDRSCKTCTKLTDAIRYQKRSF